MSLCVLRLKRDIIIPGGVIINKGAICIRSISEPIFTFSPQDVAMEDPEDLPVFRLTEIEKECMCFEDVSNDPMAYMRAVEIMGVYTDIAGE